MSWLAPIEIALQVVADPDDLVVGQRRVSHGGHFLEHALDEALDLGRIAGPMDRDAILGPRIPAGFRLGGDRIGGAELFANGIAQAALQQERRRPQRELGPDAPPSNGPLKTIDTSLFGAIPFRTVVWTTPAGGLTPRSRHVSRRLRGRQARDVGFDRAA